MEWKCFAKIFNDEQLIFLEVFWDSDWVSIKHWQTSFSTHASRRIIQHIAHASHLNWRRGIISAIQHSRFQASCVSTSAERGEVEAGRAAPTVSWMEKLNVFSRVVPLLPTKLIIMHNQKLRTERRGSPALSWMLVDFSILYCRH